MSALPWSAEGHGTDLLKFDVVVLDDEGRRTPGLKREDFVLTEEGTRREIVEFEVFENTPRTFVIVLDDLGLSPRWESRAREGVQRLLDEGLRNDDVVTLAMTSGTWWSGTMPSFAVDARAILTRMKGMGLSGIRQQRDQRARACYVAVEKAARSLEMLPGLKSLFLLAVTLEGLPREAMQPLFAVCRRAGLSVHLFALASAVADQNPSAAESAGRWPDRASFGVPFQLIGGIELAEATGGRVDTRSADPLRTAVQAIAEAGVSYRLGVKPPEVKPAEWREIEVAVQRPGLETRVPEGYSLEDTGPGLKAVDAAFLNANDLPDVAVAAAGFVLDASDRDAVRVLVAVERGPATGGEDEALDVRMVLTHRDTGETRQARMKLPGGHSGTVSSEFELEPGVVQARVVAVAEGSGRVGAVTRRIEVPEPGGLRISTPILTDEIHRASEGHSPQPVLRARSSFASGRRLYCQFQVYGAERGEGDTPAVEASYLLRHAEGSTVRESEWSRIAPSKGGRLVRLLGLSLEGVPPGHYELVLRVRDVQAGRMAETAEGFAIGPSPPDHEGR